MKPKWAFTRRTGLAIILGSAVFMAFFIYDLAQLIYNYARSLAE